MGTGSGTGLGTGTWGVPKSWRSQREQNSGEPRVWSGGLARTKWRAHVHMFQITSCQLRPWHVPDRARWQACVAHGEWAKAAVSPRTGTGVGTSTGTGVGVGTGTGVGVGTGTGVGSG